MDIDENEAIEEPTSSQQCDLSDVAQLMKRPLRLGDYWYIVDKKWYDACSSYIESEDITYKPEKIDNSCKLTIFIIILGSYLFI